MQLPHEESTCKLLLLMLLLAAVGAAATGLQQRRHMDSAAAAAEGPMWACRCWVVQQLSWVRFSSEAGLPATLAHTSWKQQLLLLRLV